MPIRNKEQDLGGAGGSGSLDSPFEKNSISGIPDVRFSDTSQPVFKELYLVYGTWNMPITGLNQGDIIFSWNMKQGFPGTITLTFTPNSNSCTIHLEFQPNSRGEVFVEIKQNSAVSAVDNRSFGPPDNRGFTVSFDSRFYWGHKPSRTKNKQTYRDFFLRYLETGNI